MPTSAHWARRFARGVEYSYASLSDPVEGTILTVMRRATEYANGRITENSTPAGYISDYLEEGGRALEDTPSLLPVLKEAGTVDSGGAGLLALMHGFADVLAGRRPAEDRGAEATERSAPIYRCSPKTASSRSVTARTITYIY